MNNIVQTGNFISANTLKYRYGPDQDVSVSVITNSPPTYDSMDLMASYTDPLGNTQFSINNSLPCAGQYLVGLPIFSDAQLGVYNVSVSAYGYDKGARIWQASSSTTFEVAGSSLSQQITNLNVTIETMGITINDIQTQLGDIQSDLDGMSLADIRDNLNYLNQTLTYKVDEISLELLSVNESLHKKLGDVESNFLNGIS